MVDLVKSPRPADGSLSAPLGVLGVLAAHGEKVAFAASASLLALSLAWLALHDPPRFELPHAPEGTPDHPVRAVLPVLPDRVTSPEPASAWVCSYLPDIRIINRTPPPAEPLPIVPSVTALKAVADLDAITLSFSLLPLKKDETPAKLEAIVIERREAASWAEVARLPLDATTWRDTTVRPKRSAGYRVVVVSNDPLLRTAKQPLVRLSAEAVATMPAVFKASILTADPMARTACLVVERYAAGKWSRTQENHSVGSSATLKKVEDVTVTLTSKRCTSKAMQPCTPSEESRTVKVLTLTLVDDDGDTVVLRRHEPRPDEDRLCAKHAAMETAAIAALAKADALWATDTSAAATLYRDLARDTESIAVQKARDRIDKRSR